MLKSFGGFVGTVGFNVASCIGKESLKFLHRVQRPPQRARGAQQPALCESVQRCRTYVESIRSFNACQRELWRME
jgi:hypothetical protein